MSTKKERVKRFSAIVAKHTSGEILVGDDREWIMEQCSKTKAYAVKASREETIVSIQMKKVGLRYAKYLLLDDVPVTKNKLFAPKKDKKTDKQKDAPIVKALRLEIREQLLSYRWEAHDENLHCPGCDCLLHALNISVDHKYPFSAILRDWLEETGLTLKKIKLVGRGNTKKIKDPAIAESWKHFHKQKATYSLLCRSCNSSKGAKIAD